MTIVEGPSSHFSRCRLGPTGLSRPTDPEPSGPNSRPAGSCAPVKGPASAGSGKGVCRELFACARNIPRQPATQWDTAGHQGSLMSPETGSRGEGPGGERRRCVWRTAGWLYTNGIVASLLYTPGLGGSDPGRGGMCTGCAPTHVDRVGRRSARQPRHRRRHPKLPRLAADGVPARPVWREGASAGGKVAKGVAELAAGDWMERNRRLPRVVGNLSRTFDCRITSKIGLLSMASWPGQQTTIGQVAAPGGGRGGGWRGTRRPLS